MTIDCGECSTVSVSSPAYSVTMLVVIGQGFYLEKADIRNSYFVK